MAYYAMAIGIGVCASLTLSALGLGYALALYAALDWLKVLTGSTAWAAAIGIAVHGTVVGGFVGATTWRKAKREMARTPADSAR
jgi:hypothetical protein